MANGTSKSFLNRLMTSPAGKSIRDAPIFYFLITALTLVAVMLAVSTGELHLRGNQIVTYRQEPRFFLLGLLLYLGLGGLCAWWGWGKWRDHGE